MSEENIKLPTNIKQIGTIPDNNKIYMEDYVSTYLHQYSSYSINDEKIAVLIGQSYIINDSRVTFISGAVKGKYTVRENGMLTLTEKSIEYINNQIDIYFEGLEIIGWVYIQPGYSDYLNDVHLQYHKDNFREENQLLFLIDPLENLSCFFAWNDDVTDLVSIGGYIIYYSKNQGMNEYMLNNKNVNIKTDENTEPIFPEQPQAILNMPRSSRMKGRIIAEQRRMVNIFGTLSAVLFIVCFVMGVGLVQNDDRITKLEKQLSSVNESYQYLLARITSDKTQSVFAADTESESEAPTQQTTFSQTYTEPPTQSVTDEVQPSFSVSSDLYDYYTVSEGDNLYLISRKFFNNEQMVDEIMRLNNIEDADTILCGQVIKIPREY